MDITQIAHIAAQVARLATIGRSNPETVPLTKFENLTIIKFMSRLLLCGGYFHPFIYGKWDGSYHL
jgi:hypothetical protein